VKAPSKNISTSLKNQRIKARAPETVEVSVMGGRPTMTVPGDGSVDVPPGQVRHSDRSAVKYAEPMSRVK
jgi:hypothetical protein